MATFDGLCAIGDISVAATVYLIGAGLSAGTYYVRINGGAAQFSAAADAGGYYIAQYSSALPSPGNPNQTDSVELWQDLATDVKIAGPWSVIWHAALVGPPVTPSIPFPAYCPTPDPTVIQGPNWNKLDWFPSIVCDAGRNDGMFYDVQRSTSSGGTYTTIASNLTDPTYTDYPPVPGTSYFYKVIAHTTYIGGRISFNSPSPTVAAKRFAEFWGAVAG